MEVGEIRMSNCRGFIWSCDTTERTKECLNVGRILSKGVIGTRQCTCIGVPLCLPCLVVHRWGYGRYFNPPMISTVNSELIEWYMRHLNSF